MTQADKELLLKDLCARLPYGVKVEWEGTIQYVNFINYRGYVLFYGREEFPEIDIEDIKPYLRPVSSLTEEERKETEEMVGSIICYNENEGGSTLFDELGLDWLNSHHFDYRGLIKKGLALEAPEGMYKMNNYDTDRTNQNREVEL